MPGKVRFFFKRAQMLHCLTQAFKGSNFEIVLKKSLDIEGFQESKTDKKLLSKRFNI